MVKRVITGLTIVGILFPLIYLGGLLMDLMILVLMLVLSFEVSRIRKFKYQNLVLVLIFLSILGLFFCHEKNLVFYLGSIAIVSFIFPLIDEDYKLVDILVLFMLIFMAAMAIIGLKALRDTSVELTFLVIVGTYATDSFAFFIGSWFGKHRLAPKISPNKSVEGAIGGWIGGCLFTIGFRYLFYPQLQLELMILLAIFMPIISQIGDLAFSFIKRSYGIKDYGTIFADHGGVFDRIDSLIFALIFANFLLNVVIR